MLLALLLLALLAAHCTAEQTGLGLPAKLITGSSAFMSDSLAFVPHTSLDGRLRGTVVASNLEDCGTKCLDDAQCMFFSYCEETSGCTMPGGSQVDYQDCWLLEADANNTSGMPQVATQGPELGTTSGFPLRLGPTLLQYPTLTVSEALGVAGTPITCGNASLIPGQCAVRSPLEAAKICTDTIPSCRSVTVYTQGIAGLSGPVAVLSSTGLSPTSTFLAPTVYSMSKTSDRPVLTDLLLASEGAVILPPEGAPANDSWHGCVLAEHAAMAGIVVQRGSDNRQPSPEACCRSCRAFNTTPAGGCTVWNYCAREGGCTLRTGISTVLQLAQGECELRYQEAANLTNGSPPAVISKGEAVSFWGGAPLVSASASIPGYTMLLGRGLFEHGRFNCSQSLRPQLQECVLNGTLPSFQKACEDDPQCVALIFKPSIYSTANEEGSKNGIGVLKHSANMSFAILTPTGTLYVRDEPRAAASADSQGSGLSAGAIAGIAVGAVAGATLLAAAGLVLRRRHRRAVEATAACDGAEAKAQHQLREVAVWPPGSPPQLSACTTSGPTSYSSSVARNSATQGRSAGASSSNDTDKLAAEEYAGLKLELDAQISFGQSLASIGSAGSQFSAESLPTDLQAWVVSPADINYVLGPDGKPVELGAGAFGRVLKAEYKGETVAAKEVPLDKGAAAQKAFVTECARLHQLRHPHIVGFVGVAVNGDRGYLLMELCEGRDLHALVPLRMAPGMAGRPRQLGVPSSTGTVPGDRVFGWYRKGRQVALDVARGLNYLHAVSVVHLDIKSSNVLLTSHGVAKLADVGFARTQTRTFLSDLHTIVGTFSWVAPEILMGAPCSLSVDIYSFGVVLWEIVTGERPSRGNMRAPVVPDECPQEVADLITRCTAFNPTERPSAKELLHTLMGLVRGPTPRPASALAPPPNPAPTSDGAASPTSQPPPTPTKSAEEQLAAGSTEVSADAVPPPPPPKPSDHVSARTG